MSAGATARPLSVGINLDGVLVHDGLSTPRAKTRLAWVAHSGAFDYIEKNIDPAEDFRPYRDLVQHYGVPIGVFGGIFCAGQDEPTMRWGLRTAGELGARVFNMQLYARHASGDALSDQQVADWFSEALALGDRAGCRPSLEVHVDMWSERFERIEAVANRLARRHEPLYLTLDHSHLIFKIGNPEELAASGLADRPDGARDWLAPRRAHTFYNEWLRQGWVIHAHARSVATGAAVNPAMRRGHGRQGRAIQYPLVEPAPGTFHRAWDAQALVPWKTALRDLLAWMHRHPEAAPAQISCEFIPFADYGGGARYPIWANNLACAAWLRQEWAALCAAPVAPPQPEAACV